MAFKHCWFRECTPKHCKDPKGHPFYVSASWKGQRERGPVSNYLFLLPAGSAEPDNKADADLLEAKVKQWLKDGRPTSAPAPPTPDGSTPPPAPRPTGPAPTTIPDAVRAYAEAVNVDIDETRGTLKPKAARKVGGTDLSADGGISSVLKRFRDDLGVHNGKPRDVIDLFDQVVVEAYLQRVATIDMRSGEPRPTPSAASYNAALKRLRPMSKWIRGRFKKYDPRLQGVELPYFDAANNPDSTIKVDPTGENKRTVRPLPNEQRALLQAARDENDGGLMEARIRASWETPLRQGALRRVERSHIVTTTKGLAILQPKRARSKNRTPHMAPIVTPELRKFINARMADASIVFIFGTLDGSRALTKDQLRTIKDRVWKRAGLLVGEYEQRTTKNGNRYGHWIRDKAKSSRLTWHDGKHEFTSSLGDAKIHPKRQQAATGHARLDQMADYDNPYFDDVYDDVKRAIMRQRAKRKAV